MVSKRVKIFSLFLALVLLAAVGAQAVLAAPRADEVPACSKDAEGMIVSYDSETHTVIIDTGEGLCSVELKSVYTNPLWSQLGMSWGELKAALIAQALKDTQGCAVWTGEEWVLGDCAAEGSVKIQITGQNEDGTFAAIVTIDGTAINVTIGNGTLVKTIREALAALHVDWPLDDQGRVDLQALQELRREGVTLKVMERLYAAAAAAEERCKQLNLPDCQISVDELVAAWQGGASLREILQGLGFTGPGMGSPVIPHPIGPVTGPVTRDPAAPPSQGAAINPELPAILPGLSERMQERLQKAQEILNQAANRGSWRSGRP